MYKEVMAEARPSKAPKREGRIVAFEGEVLDNGFLLRFRREVKGDKGMNYPYTEPEKVACKNVGEVVKQLKAKLGESAEHEAGESAEHESAEHSGKGRAAAEERAEEG